MVDSFKGSAMKKKFFEMLASSIGAQVVVERAAGLEGEQIDIFKGRLMSFNPDTMDIWLADVMDKENMVIAKEMMINGETIMSIRTIPPVLDLKDLASKLKKAGLEARVDEEEGAVDVAKKALIYRNGQVITTNERLRSKLEKVLSAALSQEDLTDQPRDL
ncbi:MAG: hypothetical protein ACP5UU_03940 [Thermoprotei archaeon]|jgi:small nuclear ribonucleoprotein (snRNP)-like protein